MPRSPSYPECFDECKQITITSLKLLGYLKPHAIVSGSYRWTRNGQPSGWICLKANISDRFVELDYNYGNQPIKYRVRLESIEKHFGGREWYFICPATGKRCRVLYGIGQYFLSRSAYPAAMYSQQTESKSSRDMLQIFKCVNAESDFVRKRHSRTTYNGELTKRFRRILDKQGRFDPDRVLRFLAR